MDSDAIKAQEPIIGPLAYALYTFSVIFIGFTIMIAIIADAYEDAKNEDVKAGILHYVWNWVEKKFNIELDDDPDLAIQNLDRLDAILLKMDSFQAQLTRQAEIIEALTQQRPGISHHQRPASPTSKSQGQSRREPHEAGKEEAVLTMGDIHV